VSGAGADAAAALDAAVRDNAAWCDLVCSAAGVPTRTEPQLWTAVRRSPPLHPDAVTLAPGASPELVLSRIDRGPGCSVKDSFRDLELGPSGFRVLVDGTWIWHPAPIGRGAADRRATVGRWAVVGPGDHPAWLAARAEPAGLPLPALVHPSVRVVADRDAAGIRAGAVLTVGPDGVGIGNLFVRRGDRAGAWPAVVRTAAGLAPGRPLFGWETGADLAAARAAGFRPVGQLRVWHVPAQRGDGADG